MNWKEIIFLTILPLCGGFTPAEAAVGDSYNQLNQLTHRVITEYSIQEAAAGQASGLALSAEEVSGINTLFNQNFAAKDYSPEELAPTIQKYAAVTPQDNLISAFSTRQIKEAQQVNSNFEINADGVEKRFNGYSRENGGGSRVANDVYVNGSSSVLTLRAMHGGLLQFDDGINGVSPYKIVIDGDDASSVVMNAPVENAERITLNNTNLLLTDESFLNGTNFELVSGKLDLHNGRLGQAVFNDFSGANGILSLDVNPDNSQADQLVINGDLSGRTKLLVHALSPNQPENDIKFAEVHNDNAATEGSFEVWRVNGSPYQWATKYDTALKEWYLNTLGAPGNQLVAPETIAYMGLNAAGLEQNRNMLRNIRNKIGSNLRYSGWCGGFYDRCYNGVPLYNVWAAPVIFSARDKKPVRFDADITGIEAGGDIQINAYNRLGIFGSYRDGDYDIDGRSSFYTSLTGSKIDIDSYVGGVYYRFDYRNLWLMATAYAGVEEAKIKTDDGVHAKSDGSIRGGSVEAGLALPMSKQSVAEPQLSLSYAEVSFDNIHDEVGKTARFGDARQIEAEAGIKLEKTYELDEGYAKLYFKPSLVQTFTSGDEVNISGLNQVNSLDDETLIRFGAGGTMDFSENLNGFVNAEYTFNHDYHDASISLGLSYSF